MTTAKKFHVAFIVALFAILTPLWLPMTLLRLAWACAATVENLIRTEPS